MGYGKVIFDLFTPVFKQKQIRYLYKSSPETFYTIFDQDKIEKIISNLLSNAFKHSDAQSEINFSIEVDKTRNDSFFHAKTQVLISTQNNAKLFCNHSIKQVQKIRNIPIPGSDWHW